MVVTATHIERTLFETPRAVTVVGGREVDEAGVSSTSDLFCYASGAFYDMDGIALPVQ